MKRHCAHPIRRRVYVATSYWIPGSPNSHRYQWCPRCGAFKFPDAHRWTEPELKRLEKGQVSGG